MYWEVHGLCGNERPIVISNYKWEKDGERSWGVGDSLVSERWPSVKYNKYSAHDNVKTINVHFINIVEH